jgi:hypothetical protein
MEGMAVRQRAVSGQSLRSVSTPDRIVSRLGVLEFDDGAPSPATADLLYDHLDFSHAVAAYLGALPGVSLEAIRRGLRSIGVEDDSFVIFSDLMDSASLFLTANCDTVYFWGFIDLTDGPKVVDIPPLAAPTGILGTIDDMWFRWVTDVGLPGPDRAQGGRYLFVGPGYEGPLPDGGYFVTRARTNRITLIGRAFLIDNDPSHAVETIRWGIKVSPYVSGARGTAVASYLAGRAPYTEAPRATRTRFIEGSGVPVNTVPPNDFSFWTLVDDLVQREPVGAGDPEVLGLLASVGIVKGKPFEPGGRARQILEQAVIVGNAAARTLSMAPRRSDRLHFYGDSQWFNPLFVGGHEFMDPPARITAAGVVQSPSDGARKINARASFFYYATGITPAMCMYLTGIGSQYLAVTHDSEGAYFDGGRAYKLTLPPEIPQGRFWSVAIYDRQTRSMLQTGQSKPSIGSQSGTVETNADGATEIHFGPTAPAGKESNWLQTVRGKGWWAILRLYDPLQPFFDKTWRPSEIEPV